MSWEKQAADRGKWRIIINIKVIESEQAREMAKEEKRAVAKIGTPAALSDTSVVCAVCGRVCASRIGLHSHSRRCTPLPNAVSAAPPSSYTCPYCRELFSARHRLYNHLRTHHQHLVDWSGGEEVVNLCQQENIRVTQIGGLHRIRWSTIYIHVFQNLFLCSDFAATRSTE